MKLKDSGKVTGLVVLNQTDTNLGNPAPSPPYSNDLTCPNKMTGSINELVVEFGIKIFFSVKFRIV